MSNILSKGKRIDNGEWVEGFYVCLNDTEHRIYTGYAETDCGDYYPDCYSVDAKSVCQYIGRSDNNGKRIFNNDVVSVKDNGKEIYRFVVKYGICGGVKNSEHIAGYVGFYFAGANEKTQKELYQGLRNDILFWLNDSEYFCEVVGRLDSEGLMLEGK